jgi:4-hydroxythreonine-4-phosphate dehydrogenase
MTKIKIGISAGDFNGISTEVILKAIADERLLEMCEVVIYGSAKVLGYHKNIVQNLGEITLHQIAAIEEFKAGEVNVVNVGSENIKIALGTVSEEAGRFALAALEQATADLKAGNIDALVTAPIHKKAMQLAEFGHTGHTEYLTAKFGATQSLMLMVSDTLRIGVATNHIPLQEVSRSLTKDGLLRKLQLMHDTLRIDFGIDRPTIAVLGLNPHASDEGTIGQEEAKIIIPALEAAKKANILAMGPYPADGFFGSGAFRQFDGILAMYHDQGLIPFKLLSFEAGVNYTAGLNFVRTSPDHGTAYNIVGQNAASPDSMLKAIFLAIDVVKQRSEYREQRSNPLQTIAVDEKLFEDEAI